MKLLGVNAFSPSHLGKIQRSPGAVEDQLSHSCTHRSEFVLSDPHPGKIQRSHGAVED